MIVTTSWPSRPRTPSSTSSPPTAPASPTSTPAGWEARSGAASRATGCVAGCHMGANLVPVQCTPDDVGLFADRALTRVRSTATIVGPHDAVAAFWDTVADRWAAPREVRWRQPHLQIADDPVVAADPEVRVTTAGDLTALYPACVDMYTEEVGVSPETGRRQGPLSGPRPTAHLARMVLRPLRRARPGHLQGRGRVRDALRRPGAGCLRPPRPSWRRPLRRGMARSSPWSASRSHRPSRSTSTSGTPRPARPTPVSASLETPGCSTLMF